MKNVALALGLIFTVVLMAALAALILGFFVWMLWPYSGQALGLPAISYLEATALSFVCSVLFRGSSTKSD